MSWALRVTAGWVVASVCAGASAMHIVGWSSARGGAGSLASSPGYSSARDALQQTFPGVTFGTTDTITPASLAGADVVWLGTGFDDYASITALSGSEQAALLAFVQNGGRAVLFADNDTFSVGAPAANNSLMNTFGCTTSGSAPAESIKSLSLITVPIEYQPGSAIGSGSPQPCLFTMELLPILFLQMVTPTNLAKLIQWTLTP